MQMKKYGLLASSALLALIANFANAQNNAPAGVPEKVLLDNDAVKIIELTLQPGDTYTFTPAGNKTCPRAVAVMLSPEKAKIQVTYSKGKTRIAQFKLGKIYKQDGFGPREAKNLDKVPIEFMYVDYKNITTCKDYKKEESSKKATVTTTTTTTSKTA